MPDQVFTARQKQQAAARELGFRRRVYATRVAEGRMKPSDAEYQIAVIAAIEVTATETYQDPDDMDCCPNCGGDGVVYNCFEEYACVDPESGCDLCARRCDWCRTSRPSVEAPTSEAQENG